MQTDTVMIPVNGLKTARRPGVGKRARALAGAIQLKSRGNRAEQIFEHGTQRGGTLRLFHLMRTQDGEAIPINRTRLIARMKESNVTIELGESP